MSGIPASPRDLTAAWLSSVLEGCEVASFEVTDIGEGVGIFGEIVRITLTYATAPSDAPATLVAKFPTPEPANLAVGVALGIYRREVRFYQDVAPHTDVRVPRCYGAYCEGDRSVILLEDLGRFECGDQIIGITGERAEQVLDALATVHARWWERPEVFHWDWLPTTDSPMYLATVPDIFHGALPILVDKWSDRLGPEAIALARAVDARFEEILGRSAARPHTYIHTDSRLDNILFAPDGVVILDWQLAVRGRGVSDAAYLIGSSMNIADQRLHWERLVRHYHARLVALGVKDYPIDQCLHEYREAALYYLVGPMSLIGTFDAGNERGAAMVEAFATRFFAHVLDIDAIRVL